MADLGVACCIAAGSERNGAAGRDDRDVAGDADARTERLAGAVITDTYQRGVAAMSDLCVIVAAAVPGLQTDTGAGDADAARDADRAARGRAGRLEGGGKGVISAGADLDIGLP